MNSVLFQCIDAIGGIQNDLFRAALLTEQNDSCAARETHIAAQFHYLHRKVGTFLIENLMEKKRNSGFLQARTDEERRKQNLGELPPILAKVLPKLYGKKVRISYSL